MAKSSKEENAEDLPTYPTGTNEHLWSVPGQTLETDTVVIEKGHSRMSEENLWGTLR